ncbi:MAG: TAXI family TRAP transporter solute-binding subunit [Rhizomicrobium sp.]
MILRRAAWMLLAGLALPVLGLALVAANLGPAEAFSQRISFQILTGSTGGTYFPLGQLIAGLISHPPGVDRCEGTNVCGPSGLIISARTSAGAVANVLAVNAGEADSGLAQGDVVAAAVAGKAPFHAVQSDIRVIADLFPEDVHLLVARGAKIAGVADLKGKRVSLGADNSGTSATAHVILAAYGIPEWRLKVRRDGADIDAQAMQRGQLDAFFFVGGRPVGLVGDLIARGIARLVPIDGKGRDRLVRSVPALVPDVIPAGTYRGMPAVQTVSVRALWIVNAKAPDGLVYGLARALFDPGNRAALDDAMHGAWIRLDSAVRALPAPLHAGAMRFYHDVGKLPMNNKAGKM